MENSRRRGKPLEKDYRISKETGYIQKKKQTARKGLEHFRIRNKPLEGDQRISKRDSRNWKKGGKPFENDQRKSEEGRNLSKMKARRTRSKLVREFQKKEQNARRNQRISEQGANRSNETKEFRKQLEQSNIRSKPIAKELKSFRAKSKSLEKNQKFQIKHLLEKKWRIPEEGTYHSKEVTELEIKEQNARTRLENCEKDWRN